MEDVEQQRPKNYFNPDPKGVVWVIAHVTWYDPETGDWRNFEASGPAEDIGEGATTNAKKVTVSVAIGDNTFKLDRSGQGRPYSGT